MKTILLIDDDEQVRDSFGLALRQGGYRVLTAESGSAGLEVALRQLPDLILTDINMPGGNGQKLLEQIRESPVLTHKQVVLMTGQPHLVTPRGGMEAGADDFLVKPIAREALLRCMEARLKRAEIHWRVEDRMLATLRSSLQSNLPHEFFTPLAGIIGLSDILLADSATFSAEELSSLYRDIQESAVRLHRTLRNYLLILEFQGLTQEPEGEILVPSAKEWRDTILAAAATASRQDNRTDDLTVVVEGSPTRVRSSDLLLIVEELVDNACKFSRPQTPISVRYDLQGTLTVTDQGRGMAAEEIRQIGAFRQFDRKKYEHQGLGLGLILVQKLASRYGASFSIASEPGQGARVQIVFPDAAASRN